jgi:hypothetical protein
MEMWRILILTGVALTLAGGFLWLGAKAGIGRLPGDILYRGENVWIAIPIATSIVISIVLTIILNIVLRFAR